MDSAFEGFQLRQESSRRRRIGVGGQGRFPSTKFPRVRAPLRPSCESIEIRVKMFFLVRIILYVHLVTHSDTSFYECKMGCFHLAEWVL